MLVRNVLLESFYEFDIDDEFDVEKVTPSKNEIEGFIESVENHDVDKVKYYLSEFSNVYEYLGRCGYNALGVASAYGFLDIVKLLVEELEKEGSSLDVKDKDGCTALMEAASRGKTEVVEYLIAHGSDVNARNNDDETPLILAVSSTQPKKIISLLLDAGADINARDNQGYTALDVAASCGLRGLATFLKNNGGEY